MARPRHAQAQSEKDDPVTARLHAPCQILQHRQRRAGGGVRLQRRPTNEAAQGMEGFKIAAGPHRHEQVRLLSAGRRSHVHHDESAVGPAAGGESTSGQEGIALEVAGVALDGIRPPEDHEVGPVLDFSQGAGGLPGFLDRHQGGAVAERGGRVDGGPDSLGQGDGGPLALGAAAGQAVNQGRAGRPQNVRRAGHGGLRRGGPAFDLSGRGAAAVLSEQPGFRQTAGAFRPDDTAAIHRHAKVVAHAAANRASDVLDDFQARSPSAGDASGFSTKGILSAVVPAARRATTPGRRVGGCLCTRVHSTAAPHGAGGFFTETSRLRLVYKDSTKFRDAHTAERPLHHGACNPLLPRIFSPASRTRTPKRT